MTAYFERDVAPKVYISDSGLACFMAGETTMGTSYIVFVKRKSKSLKNIFQISFLENGPSI